MNNLQQLLQISAKLYQHLTDVAEIEKRDEYIEKIHNILEERGILMEQINKDGFQFDPQNKLHTMLADLDKGIRKRLSTVMKVIQKDLKELKNAQKNEQQYLNPYASIQVMDGRYYDKKN